MKRGVYRPAEPQQGGAATQGCFCWSRGGVWGAGVPPYVDGWVGFWVVWGWVTEVDGENQVAQFD